MRKQLSIPALTQYEYKQNYMSALTIATRLYLTKIVKDAINRGLSKAMPQLTDNDRQQICFHIMDELGKETEEIMNVVRGFFVKSNI